MPKIRPTSIHGSLRLAGHGLHPDRREYARLRVLDLGMFFKVTTITFIAFAVLFGLSMFWAQNNWAYSDQVNYHLPFANVLIERRFNPFGPSLSATAPGAHLVYALAAVSTGAVPLTAQSPLIPVLGSIIAAGTLGFFFVAFHKASGNRKPAALLLLPIFASQYFLLPGAYFVTEGLAYFWLAVFLAATQSDTRPITKQTFAALALTALVLTRQIFLPAGMAMMFVFAMPATRWNYVLIARQLGLTLLPLVGFLPFMLYWRGLVPPEFARHDASAFNLASILQSIALLGLFTLPLVPTLWRSTSRGDRIRIFAGAALLTVPMLLLAPSDYDMDAGRFGSLIWSLARVETSLIGVSVSVFPLFALGAAALLWALMSKFNPVRLMAVGYSVYSVTLAVQSFSWQRYSDVFALALIALIAARVLNPARTGQLVFFGAFYGLYLLGSIAMRVG